MNPLAITTAVVCGQKREFFLSNRQLLKLAEEFPSYQNYIDLLDDASNGSNLRLSATLIAYASVDKSLTPDGIIDDDNLLALEIPRIAGTIAYKSVKGKDLADDVVPLAKAPQEAKVETP